MHNSRLIVPVMKLQSNNGFYSYLDMEFCNLWNIFLTKGNPWYLEARSVNREFLKGIFLDPSPKVMKLFQKNLSMWDSNITAHHLHNFSSSSGFCFKQRLFRIRSVHPLPGINFKLLKKKRKTFLFSWSDTNQPCHNIR